jgi:hypothetical protein
MVRETVVAPVNARRGTDGLARFGWWLGID